MIRLNKFLSGSGLTSRRRADELIAEGRVSVNNRVVTRLGVLINPIKDKVTVEGKTIQAQKNKTIVAFYKPRGVLSSILGEHSLRPFIEEMPGEGLFHIGRLDKESEGLLLISNDGVFAQQLIHPRFQVEKEYLVSLNRPFEREVIDQLKRGIVLDDGFFKPLRVLRAGPDRLLLVMSDGRNRVIRRAIAEVGFKVTKLVRTRVGKYELGSLRPGKWRKIYN